ncbi:hypothetical protein CBS101457_000333 [Exobasidium rhododendri]|nr:hypothetical protein CBS101457_000333 [Exobasidium rhododendri]
MEEELISALNGTMQPDVAVIKAAQDHLQHHLHLLPEVGICLINIVHAGARIPLPLRQAAAVNLSLWVKERWSPFFSGFVGFPTSEGNNIALPIEYKEPIRQALLNSCNLSEVKLRGPMIKALVNIASCDWPDEFPDLLPKIKHLLTRPAGSIENSFAIEGALAFLDDWFYTSMDETGLMSITREILPDLERILSQPEIYSCPTRCRCISIFDQMLETLWMVKEQYPEASKAVSAEIVPRWLTSLQAMVSSDLLQMIPAEGFGKAAGEQYGLQLQAWTTITTATHLPAQMKPHLSSLLSTALSSLFTLQQPFEAFHISPSSPIEDASDSAFFATPSSLAGKLIDFIGVALQSSNQKSTTDPAKLAALLPLLRSYSRITQEEEEEWLDQVSAFVAANEEDEMGGMSDSKRARCADILSELVLVKEKETMEGLRLSVLQAHEDGKELQRKGQENWWKEEEASLALIGGISEHMVEKIEDAKDLGQEVPFDIESIFALSVFPNMTQGSPFFLHGRCFVFASQFASVLPEDLAKNFLSAAVEAIEKESGSSSSSSSEGEAIIKISAIRCIKNFHRHLPSSLLRPFSGRILSRLGPILASASEDTLVLIVETLQSVAMQEGAADAQYSIPAEVYGEIIAESIKAWAREASDRILQSAVEDLLEAFAAHKSSVVAIAVIQRGLLYSSELLSQDVPLARLDKYRSNVTIEGGLEFAGAIARGANSENLSQSGAVLPFLGPLFHTLSQSDDREVFKNGATLLTSLVSKIPDEVLSWHDATGVASLQHILTLISNMISPEDTSESGGLAVGDMLTTILRKRPDSLAATLPQLCTALVTRLGTSSSTSLTQSLIVPLAFLMSDHLDTVVALLYSHDVIWEGESVSGLHILLKRWCEFASNFQGFWNTRVSTLGLCAIMKQASSQNVLDGLVVDGDLIPDDSKMIKTRSRAKLMPNRFTQIPVSAKILKIIIYEYTQAVDGSPSHSSGGVGGPGQERGGTPDTDEDDDDEWDDDVDLAKKQRQDAFLSDMLGEDLDGGLDSLLAQHDEEQYKDDAIYNMPFRSYLTTFFRELSQDGERATRLGSHLTSQELTILRSALQ